MKLKLIKKKFKNFISKETKTAHLIFIVKQFRIKRNIMSALVFMKIPFQVNGISKKAKLRTWRLKLRSGNDARTMQERRVVCHQLTPGDVFIMSATKLAYCLMTNQININYFKVIRVYNRRFIPKQWYKKLMFWQWIKMVDLVDIKFVGNN